MPRLGPLPTGWHALCGLALIASLAAAACTHQRATAQVVLTWDYTQPSPSIDGFLVQRRTGTISDPYMGSASTGVACVRLGAAVRRHPTLIRTPSRVARDRLVAPAHRLQLSSKAPLATRPRRCGELRPSPLGIGTQAPAGALSGSLVPLGLDSRYAFRKTFP